MFNNPLLKGLLLQLLKKGLYALIGVLLAFFTQAIANFQPTEPVDQALWTGLLVPLFTGIVALLKRALTWDPTKVK